MSPRAALLWIVIGSLLAAAGLGLAAVAEVSVDERPVVTAVLLAVFSLCALLGLVVIDRRVVAPLMWVGIASSGIAFALLMFSIWLPSVASDDLIVKPAGLATVVAVWAPAFGLLCVPRLHGVARVVRSATLVVTTLFAASVLVAIAVEDVDSVGGRIMLALLIVSLAGLVLTPTLLFVERVRQRDRAEERIDPRLQVELVCPRCESRQQVLPGKRQCAVCGLKIFLEIELPRCECGYLLLHMKGAVCPECGREAEGVVANVET